MTVTPLIYFISFSVWGHLRLLPSPSAFLVASIPWRFSHIFSFIFRASFELNKGKEMKFFCLQRWEKWTYREDKWNCPGPWGQKDFNPILSTVFIYLSAYLWCLSQEKLSYSFKLSCVFPLTVILGEATKTLVQVWFLKPNFYPVSFQEWTTFQDGV